MTTLPVDRLPGTDRWSADKLALLRRRLGGAGAPARPVIARADRDGAGLPLSPAQRGMWAIDQLLDDNSAYSVHQVLRLTGRLDADALRAALDELTVRHEILRTVCVGGEQPSLRIEEPCGACFQAVDLARVPAAAREGKAGRLVRDELAEPFDLETGPLFRVLLVSLAADEHLLVLNAHHILTDEWSASVLARDLSALYAQQVSGTAADLPELPIQYADYASWQHGRVGGAEHEAHLDYWRRTLGSVPGVLELPTDLPRPKAAGTSGASVETVLASGPTAAVRALAMDSGVTVFTALLAVFGAALHRFTGQERFAVGSLLSGRGLAETEPLIGLFANTAAIPADLSGRPRFADLIARTHRAVVGALDHQDAAFAQVVSALGVRRDPARNPLYQVIFQCVDETGAGGWELPGLRVEPVDVETESAKVDLTLYAVPADDSLSICLNYNAELFTESTARDLLALVVSTLELALADPSAHVPEPLRTVRDSDTGAPQASQASKLSAEPAGAGRGPTATERALTELCATVLGLDGFTAQDNFFEHGGDSLLLIHLVSRARQAGLTLTARQVYTHQTPVELAAALEGAGAGLAEPDRPAEPAPPHWPLSGLDAEGAAVLLRDRAAADIEDVYTLTPLQSGVLVHSLIEPTGYLRRYVLTLEDVDAELLRAAWQRVIDRHAGLRTSFVWQDLPHPVQVVAAQWPVSFTQVDLADEPVHERERRLRELLEAERAREFDLSAAPPSRFTLVRLSARSHRLVWSTHHIVFDGWTVQIVLDEVSDEYAALRAGAHAPLPDAPPLRDYVAWLSRRDPARDAEYWRAAVGGFQDPTPLPALEPAGRGTGVDTRIAELPEDLAARLRGFARRERVTAGSVLHAAWAVLLSRHTGRPEVLFGSVQAGRSAEVDRIERMVGLLANTLPLRVAVPGAAPVAHWLREVHLRLLDLREHEHSSLIDIQRHAGVAGGQRMFETVFVFTDTGARTAAGAADRRSAAAVEAAGGEAGTGYPLAMEVRLDGAMTLRLTYDRALFTEPAARVLQEHFEQLLREMLDGAGTVADLGMASEAELDLMLRDWNDTRRAYPREATIPQLFDEAATHHPQAPALVADGTTLSYEELAARVNRLARLLQLRGVGFETPVAVALPRCAEFVVAALAVLKAGGCYVPLDPANPPTRTRWVLEDSAARIAITADAGRRGQYPPVPDGMDVAVVDLDDPETLRELDELSPEAPDCPAAPLSLVNVFYTSGSTGRPKGVVQNHRGIVRLVHDPLLANAGPGDVFLLFASVAFDAANVELWWSLLTGATVVVGPPGPLSNAEIAALLRGSGVTHMIITSGLFQQIVELDPAALSGIKVMMSGGDVLSPEAVRAAMAANPGMLMVNCYGPTENTTYTTVAPILDPADTAGKVPIGRPVPQTTVYVLDDELRPVPVGVVGELYTGGDGLARGYLNRPGATAERFLPDPFDARPGARMYRTGDLARWLPGGLLDFCGRMDGQVKIRGFRVETGEVESRLVRHPAVAAAAVAARQDAPGRKRLVGYVVPAGGARPTVGELREFLLRDLPGYMVPAAFVLLDALPVNANGKVDRDRLPAPGGERPENIGAFAAPAAGTERRLAEVWAQVLGVSAVGREDNFFELGGDSILSLRIVAQARAAGLPVTPRQVFDHQSVAALAAALDAAGAAAPAVEAEQGAVRGPAPLTPVQRWFAGWDWDHDHFAQSVRLEWSGTADPELLGRALAELVRHHDALRSRMERAGGGPRLRVADEESAQLLYQADFSGMQPGPERDAAIAAEATAAYRALRLDGGPLLRAVHFRLGGQESDQVVLGVHHLVVDTVSWGILLTDLTAAYRRLEAGEPVSLPAKTTSFRQWAQRIERHATDPAFAAESGFWLEAVPDIPALPVDFAGGANTVERSATVTASLSAEETEALLREVPAAYRARIGEILLAALAGAVHGWAGPGPVAVAVEGHGREPVFDDVDVSRTVGWFTSVYPLVVDVPARGGTAAALGAVKERMRALPHHGFGYGLARHLDPAAGPVLAGRGFPGVSFNFHSRLAQKADEGPALFRRTDPVGEHSAPGGARPFLLDVIASVEGGRLHVGWTYPTDSYRSQTIEALARGFLENIRELVSARGSTAPAAAPDDFPLAALTDAELSRVLEGHDPARVADIYPLSPIQVGILFHSVADAAGTEYFVQAVYDLDGELDADAFERAWAQVADRHPALRSTFRWDGLRRPVQLVHDGAPLGFRRLDWSGTEPAELEERTEALLRGERSAGFDLERAVPQSFVLVRLGPARHRLVWNAHHLLCDGWSVRIVLHEVLTCYAALRRGEPAALPEAAPYREHIAWLERRGHEADADFWTRRLTGLDAPTHLPVVREVAQGRHGVGVAELDLSAEGVSLLRELCRARRITVSSALQAAWALVLARYSGEPEVLFGSTQAGRAADVPGIDGMVGVFISTLPARIGVDPDRPIGAWLDSVHEHLLELRDHEHASLTAIQRRTGIPADQPLFESIFVALIGSLAQDAAGDGPDTGLTVTPREGYEQTGYPLLLAAEVGREIGFRLTYDPALVEPAAAQRLLAAFHQVVEDIAAGPEGTVGGLFRLPPQQAELVLDRWNRTAAPRPDGRTVLDLLRERAAETPGATAVEAGTNQYTYAELVEHADRIARSLHGRGIGPGSLVGVHLGRSERTVAAMLGIVAAGAAYLPLDPTYPPDRLAYIVADSGAALVLTSRGLDPIEGHAVPTLAIEDGLFDEASAQDGDGRRALPRPLPDDAVYTIYTSGSTGRPKGVDITHGSLLNLVAAISDLLGSRASDAWLGLTSTSFDISNLELFLPLVTGGRLVVVPDDAVYDGAELLALVRGRRVTHVQATPSAWRMLLTAGFDEPAVVALSGGEPLPPPLADELARRSLRLVNVYGPTETTIWSTAGTVPPGARTVTVGRPLANQTVYLLDADLEPVPVGAVGELYIGGAGLATGYRNRPGLTAERFRPDPFGRPGGRIYGTGDRAYLRDDGEIVVLGRVDNQVKIRGHRIEPGEIEACLTGHDQVDQAAVVVRRVGGADRLVAYVTGVDGTAPDPVLLRRHLLGKLPKYMVPSAFTVLDRMPYTPNGKLDRRALPDPAAGPGAARSSAEPGHTAPRTATERLLARMWAEALGREQVGVDEGYFEIGGDSLRAIQITAAARRAGLALGPRDLFTRPNIADLAAALDAQAAETAAPAAVPAAAQTDGAPRRTRGDGRDAAARLMERYRVPGLSVAVISGGEVAESWARGVPLDAVFQVGSLSKHVTALAALVLVQDGRIGLDEDVNTLLKSWKAPATPDGAPITLRGLLSHTAGLSVRGAYPYAQGEPLPSIAEVLRGSSPSLTGPVRAEVPPGEHRYSATHYAVVQALLEDVAGEPFDELVRRLVFEPLGMQNSRFDSPGFPGSTRRAVARGHRADGTPYEPGWAAIPESAAAGLWSTPADLARAAVEIHRAVAGEPALFGPDTAAALLTPVVGHEYGLGTVVRTVGGRRWIGHHGDTAGYRCQSVSDPDGGAGLVVAVDSDAGAELIRDLMSELDFGFPGAGGARGPAVPAGRPGDHH